MSQEQKNRWATLLGITPEEQVVLDAGSEHPFTCRCQTCLQWWVQMGPDGGETGNYGPFDEEEVRDACVAAGMAWPSCHMPEDG